MKYYKLVAMVIVLFLLYGCNTDSRYIPIDYDFRTGTSGIEMDFTDNSPPEEVLTNNNFLIALDITNAGASDISGGVFALTVEKDFVEVVDWNGYIMTNKATGENTARFDIRGKSQEWNEGESSRISIRAKTYVLDEQAETHTSYVLFSACYPYQTIAVEEMCIDPDIYEIKANTKVCEVQDIGLGSQGGPVAVKKIEPTMLESEEGDSIIPRFNIEISNVGKGEITNIGSYIKACSSAALESTDLNIVKVSAKLGNTALSCKPEEVIIRDNKASVQCISGSGISKGSGSYTSPLVITLDYGYMESKSKSFVIRRQNT